MIINNKFKGVVKLTSDQYQELKTVGYIVIDGKKYEYDPYSTLYMTDSMVEAVLYTPQELTEEQKLQARTNIGAGTSNFSGSYNDLTDKPEISEPIAEAIRDNTTQIVPTSGGLAIGGAFKPSYDSSIVIGRNDTRVLGNGDTAIGNHAICYTTGSYKIAIGNNSWANKHASIAIGNNAKSDASQAIQLGSGENKTDYSLQISADNIYKANTHTLTVQNAEINGAKTYGVLQGESDPTNATVGAVGQFYISTATDPASLWLCTKVETVDSTTTYTWTKQGGKQLYQHNINLGYGNVSTIVISDDSLSFDNEKLRQWLKNQGYTAAYQGYFVYNTASSVTVSGYSYYHALPNMLYTNSDASNLILNYYDLNKSLKSTITINDESINFVKDAMCQLVSTSLLNNTITDTVVAL